MVNMPAVKKSSPPAPITVATSVLKAASAVPTKPRVPSSGDGIDATKVDPTRKVEYPALALAPALPADLNKNSKTVSFITQAFEIIGASFVGLWNWLKNAVDEFFDPAFRIDGPTPKEMAARTNSRLGDIASDLIERAIKPRECAPGTRARAAEALMRILTARGPRPGHIDQISQHIPFFWEAGKYMAEPQKSQYAKLMDSRTPKRGDWATTWQRFADLNGTQSHAGSKVEPLVTGAVAFPAMYKAIDAATPSDGITLSTYEFDSDQTSQDFARHLAAAQKRGVPVRILWDSLGTRQNAHTVDERIFDYLTAAGVQVIRKSPGPLADKCYHRKSMVIGNQAFIGGMNVGDDYAVLWRDVQSCATGPVVDDLQHAFVTSWIENGGKLTPDLKRMNERVTPPVADAASDHALITAHEGMSADMNIKVDYINAIDTATTSIHMSAPYFIDPDIMAHLKARAKEGLDVTIVMPRHNDMSIIKPAELQLYKDLIKSGVKVYEYYGKIMAHEKVAVFDGKYSTIGSSNIDPRSFLVDDELNIWSDSKLTADGLESTIFGADLKQSQRITEGSFNFWGWLEDGLLMPFL